MSLYLNFIELLQIQYCIVQDLYQRTIRAVCSFIKEFMYMNKSLSGRLRELKNKGKVKLSNPKGGRGRLRELFITKFKSQFKRGVTKVFVIRAGRLREWSQVELRLCVFLFHVINKNENVIINNLSGTFWKSQKLIPSKKNQSVLIAKIRSRKTQKSPIHASHVNTSSFFKRHSLTAYVIVHWERWRFTWRAFPKYPFLFRLNEFSSSISYRLLHVACDLPN